MTTPSQPGPQTHTPNASISAPITSSSGVVDNSAHGDVPRVRSDAMLPPPTTLGDPTPILVPCSEHYTLVRKDRGKIIPFRGFDRVEQLLKIFTTVKVRTVEAFVYQHNVAPLPDPKEYASDPEKFGSVYHARFGIVPRDLATTFKKGNDDYSAIGYVPSLHSLAFGRMNPAQARVIWGEGGLPFPPGVQLDLRAIELRSNYACFMLAHTCVQSTDTHKMIGAQLNLVVECSGVGFANIH